MGNIYRQADRVIFRLGLGSKWTDVFMDSLQWLQSESLKHVCKDWSRQDSRWEKLWASYRPPSGECHVDLVKSQCQGLQEILDEPWFRRVWILQEVALAKAGIISCGTKSVSARLFNLTPLLLGATPNAHCQFVLDIMPSQWKESTWWSGNRTFRKLLLKFGRSEASEPLDLVYALRGMASDFTGGYGKWHTLFPNYEKRQDQLAQDVIKHLYRNYLDLFQWQPLLSMRELINIIPKLEVDICRSLLEESRTHGDLKKLLQRPELPGQEMMKAAAQYDKSGKVVRELLRYRGEKYKIEEDVLVFAATNLTSAKQAFEIFLGHQNQLIINEKMLIAAAEVSGSGHLVMGFILSLETPDYKITPVLEAVARNRSGYSRAEIIRVLLQQKNNSNNTISELLTAAANIQCYGPCILKNFVPEKPDFKIAEYAIIAAMKDWRGGVDCLRVILRYCPSYITITRGIIQAASNSPDKCSTAIALLLHNPAVHDQLSKEGPFSAMTPIINQALVQHLDFDKILSQDSIHEFSARNRKSKLESLVREMGEDQDFFDKDVISSVKLYGIRVVEDLFIFRRKEAMINNTCIQHFLNEFKAEVKNSCDMNIRYSFQRKDILDTANEQKRVIWSDGTLSKEIEEIRYPNLRDIYRKYPFRQRDKDQRYPFQQRNEDEKYANKVDTSDTSLFISEEERRYWGPWIQSDEGYDERRVKHLEVFITTIFKAGDDKQRVAYLETSVATTLKAADVEQRVTYLESSIAAVLKAANGERGVEHLEVFITTILKSEDDKCRVEYSETSVATILRAADVK
ncbi:uncharacterized protein TrAtP1_009280 [Trichoderma atroviride]|uniref:uncharacterized protein n=1 Tax=Hypocrea atroviridis TaxID=63577 RepID=UPI00332D44C6|nr:hypothetical protein TrAtP1_009280 [Trichoderma atroviride]